MDWTLRLDGQRHRVLAAVALSLALFNLRFVVEAAWPEVAGLRLQMLVAQLLLSYVVMFWVRLVLEALRRYVPARRPTTIALPSSRPTARGA
jgi:hypothetical protein